jgi:hypothetical protein
MILSRPLLLCALLASLAVGAPSASAGKKISPIAEHLATLSVGGAREFRLAVVHPIFGPKLTANEHGLQAAAKLEADALGWTARRNRVELVNLQKGRTLLLPGEIVRGPRADLSAETYVTTDANKRSSFRTRLVSDEQPSDLPKLETRLVGDLLPPTLRWHATHGSPKELRKELLKWTRSVDLKTVRKSVLDLALSSELKARVGEYEKALAATSKAPAGTALAGYALLIDGDLAQIETFSSPKLLQAWWPRILRSIAVECAVLETQHSLLEEVMAAGTDPDRHLKLVKERLLTLYAAKAKASRLPGVGEQWVLELPHNTSAQSLVIDDKVAAMYITVRPDRRKVTTPDEKLDPGAISRKKRPTEAERRWLERRKTRNPPIPPVSGPGND